MLRNGSSRRETKAVKEQLGTLRGEILAAFIAEQADDAQVRQISRGGGEEGLDPAERRPRGDRGRRSRLRGRAVGARR